MQSGAHTLVLGNYVAHFGQLKNIALSKISPLRSRDVIGVDKQDDRAAARLFSSAVVDYLSSSDDRLEYGLTVYLYIVGELVDAQQCRHSGFNECMKILWRARFFLNGWITSIYDHPHYTSPTHFISRELFDIFNIFIDGMLGLILIHRDYYPNTPLLLWLHSTECCEHFFGCARKIIKDFSFLDLIYMMPKLSLLIDRDLHTGGKAETKGSAQRSGYHHTWHDSRGVNYKMLSTFPSDDEIETDILPAAFDEAKQLLEALGITTAQDRTAFRLNIAPPGTHSVDFLSAAAKFLQDFRADQAKSDTQGSDLVEDMEATGQLDDVSTPSEDDEDADVEHDRSEGNQLNELLIESSKAGNLMDHQSEMAIRTFGVTATAAAMHQMRTIDEFPEAQDPELSNWQSSIEDCLQAVQARLEEEARRLANIHHHTVISRPRRPRLVFYSRNSGLDYGLMVSERQNHETAEARAAITWRYRRHAEAATTAGIDPPTNTTVLQSTLSTQDTVPLSSPDRDIRKLKAKLVNEVVRIQTAFEESKK